MTSFSHFTFEGMSRNKVRIAVAVFVASVATVFTYAEHLRTHGRHGDFGIVWFGARSLLRGVDPYPLVGPGLPFSWDWQLYYPATSMVAVLPLGLLPELPATLVFVWISAALLAYALTEHGWDRLWILPSAAFMVAVRAADWSPLYSAAFLMAPVAFILCAKPTLGLAIAGAARSLRAIRFAAAGFAVLTAVSLAMLPEWPAEWIHVIRSQQDVAPAVAWVGGPLILLAALRWRMPEGRLLLAMSLVHSTAAWYEALPLLLIGRTKRECQALSLISSVGYIVQGAFLTSGGFVARSDTRILMMLFCYLPALWVVLRRPGAPSGALAIGTSRRSRARVGDPSFGPATGKASP